MIMAPDCSCGFLESESEQAFRTSPFYVHHDDVASLQSSKAFRVIQNSLEKQHDSAFCAYHRLSDSHDKEAWLLQRAITHALVLPVLWIYRYASRLATSLLGDRNIVDLELVFRGEARGAFAWLQCFMVEEEDWCMTRGCPACVVSHILQAEPTIRIVLVAGRLSQSLRHCGGSPSPVLDFWLLSLRKALEEDIFWGPGFWEDIDARASWLEQGIRELVRQCFELANLVPGRKLGRASPFVLKAPAYDGSVVSAKPQTSKIDNPMTSNGGSDFLKRILLRFWNTISADAAEMEANGSLSMAYLQPYN